jgi:O-methyltransferase involved in polyketide biosynthesis
MPKLRLETANAVSKTLLIPLWARAVEQREADPLVVDRLAAEMVATIDYDWRRVRLSRGDLVQCVVRLREFDRFVRDFLARHPNGTVVQLGSGMDARFQRVDNGQVRWFDLDLPDVITLRRQLVPESERNRYLASSVLDRDWMDEVIRPEGSAILFVAEAVLPYLEQAQVKAIFAALQDRYPGAELVTDVCSPFALGTDNLQLLVAGSSARMHWSVRDPLELESWSFDDPEPRMGIPTWFGRMALIATASTIQRYELGARPG